ncbi:hypothetical protein MTQ07_30630, partial [Micromonospora sp. R42003]|nr:hypothetical protein [Micromonospora sp. R42003]
MNETELTRLLTRATEEIRPTRPAAAGWERAGRVRRARRAAGAAAVAVVLVGGGTTALLHRSGPPPAAPLAVVVHPAWPIRSPRCQPRPYT